MADMKFQVGDPVFYYTMIDRIPGIIESAGQDENGHWVYVIRISDTMYANNYLVPQHIETNQPGKGYYHPSRKRRMILATNSLYSANCPALSGAYWLLTENKIYFRHSEDGTGSRHTLVVLKEMQIVTCPNT